MFLNENLHHFRSRYFKFQLRVTHILAIDPDLNLALIVNEKEKDKEHKHGQDKDNDNDNDYTVSVIDLNTYLVIGEVLVGKKPSAIDINPETHLSAVANEKDNSITVINLKTWHSTTISACKHPIDIVINQLDNRALVLCDEDRNLLLIDLTPFLFPPYQGGNEGGVKTYPLNKNPKGVAVNNFTNIAAVIDEKTDSLTLIQLPNPVPEITSLTRDNTQRGGNEVTIEIQGNKFIKSSSASLNLLPSALNLQPFFIDNHHIQITIPKDKLTKAGIFPITVTNPAPEGGISNSIGFTVNNPLPTITALDPAEAIVGTPALTLNIYGTGFFDDTEIYFGDIKKQAIYISNTKLQAALTSEDLKTPGQYEIAAYNPSPGGGYSNKIIFTIKPNLEIKITSPSDGATINKAKTMVRGTFKSGTQDVGITVNGVIAEIKGDEWIANDVPLTVGTNTITAIIKDGSGNSANASVTINTTDISQPVTLSANITSGIAPLTTYFSVSTSFTPVSYQMDFEGDGAINYTGTTFEDISHTYAAEGIFYPTVTVTDNQGNNHSDTIAITVLNKTEMDTLLKGKWSLMAESLSKGNTTTALTYIASFARASYQQMFSALIGQLSSIIATQKEFNLISVKENIAEYELATIENGKTYSYEVIFIKDTNGVWMIQEF